MIIDTNSPWSALINRIADGRRMKSVHDEEESSGGKESTKWIQRELCGADKSAIYSAKEKMRVANMPAKFRVLEKLCGTINTFVSRHTGPSRVKCGVVPKTCWSRKRCRHT
jgi:hypothetical protein